MQPSIDGIILLNFVSSLHANVPQSKSDYSSAEIASYVSHVQGSSTHNFAIFAIIRAVKHCNIRNNLRFDFMT